MVVNTADEKWGDYGPVIRRWEQITGTHAPCPTETGTRANRRLSPVFVEWMMGLGSGWVTGVPDVPRKEQLRILGNGVVWQQAAHAFGHLLNSDYELEKSMDDKTKGSCVGCGFEYTLSAKGLVRKHLSRTGPGECSGSRAKPVGADTVKEAFEGAEIVQHAATEAVAEPVAEPVADPFESPTHVSDQPLQAATAPVAGVAEPVADSFTTPGPASDMPTSTVTVSGQPDPDRDRWGRYLILGTAHTRATTFARLGSNTKAIEQWGHRQVVQGLTLRPDLLALAHGLDVKQDRKELNSIVEQARDTAGQKVAANIGTAYHAFSDRLDAGRMTLAEVPPAYRNRLAEYVHVRSTAGLRTQTEWIERTTAVSGDMVSAPLPVAGKLDRIDELPTGDLVITDLKTGSDLSYGMAEIEVQLAIYAHGVNAFGLFDWVTKSWQKLDKPVREDIAIVVHLPADGVGCELLKVDIERGWRRAQLRGKLQADQKEKSHVQPLTANDLNSRFIEAPVQPPVSDRMNAALVHFQSAPSKERIAELYQYALDSGLFLPQELKMLIQAGHARMAQLGV